MWSRTPCREPVKAAPLEGDFHDDEAIDCATWWYNATGEDLGEGEEAEDVAALDEFLPQSRAKWR